MAVRDRAHERMGEYLRATGRAGWVPAGRVRQRLRHLHDRCGITFDVLADRTGMDRVTVQMQYWGFDKSGKEIHSCQMATERAVLGARFTPADADYVMSAGVRRRIQGLQALGYTLPFLADRLPVFDYRNLHRVSSGGRSVLRVKAELGRAVVDLYGKLAMVCPEDAGVDRQSASRARSYARRNRYAPPGCWDDDTIDDPAAFPEWTGSCGTLFGRMVHESQGIPVCGPCGAAAGSLAFRPDLFRAIRERRHLSRVRLGSLVGVNASTIQYWETGRSQPTRKDRITVALKALDATYQDVYEEVPDGECAE